MREVFSGTGNPRVDRVLADVFDRLMALEEKLKGQFEPTGSGGGQEGEMRVTEESPGIYKVFVRHRNGWLVSTTFSFVDKQET